MEMINFNISGQEFMQFIKVLWKNWKKDWINKIKMKNAKKK